MVIARARPQQPEEGDWRARVLTVAERGARARGARLARGADRAGAAAAERPRPRARDRRARHRGGRAAAADAVLRELEAGLDTTASPSRSAGPRADPVDLHRAGAEALLAANVAEARGLTRLSFEETGAYRLLLPAMSEDPSELRALPRRDGRAARRLRRAVRDGARPHPRVVPRRRRQRRRHRREALHPPPHDPLPARARARADGPRRGLDRRPRAPLARPQGDAGARHRCRRAAPPRSAAPRPAASRGRTKDRWRRGAQVSRLEHRVRRVEDLTPGWGGGTRTPVPGTKTRRPAS